MSKTEDEVSKLSFTQSELQQRIDAVSAAREASGRGCNLDIGFEILLADVLRADIAAEQKVALCQQALDAFTGCGWFQP
jgi:hypothetical protein